jgi:hypothetical protein
MRSCKVKKARITRQNNQKSKNTPNERAIELVDKKLKKWIKVIKPSRPNLVYDRME